VASCGNQAGKRQQHGENKQQREINLAVDLLYLLTRWGLIRVNCETLLVDLGYKCYQTCQHCHVNAGPTRKEMMDEETIDLVLQVLKARRLTTLDLTGGAPEMNPHFRHMMRQARELGVHMIDRCAL